MPFARHVNTTITIFFYSIFCTYLLTCLLQYHHIYSIIYIQKNTLSYSFNYQLSMYCKPWKKIYCIMNTISGLLSWLFQITFCDSLHFNMHNFETSEGKFLSEDSVSSKKTKHLKQLRLIFIDFMT